MAVLTKSNSRFRLAIVTAVIFIIVFLSFTKSPEVRTQLKTGISKIQGHKDVSDIQKGIIMGTNDLMEYHWWDDVNVVSDQNFTIYRYWMGPNHEEGFLKPRHKKGRESAAYLSFLVDNYDDLPKYSIFLHSGAEQWHNDVSWHKTADMIPVLRYQAVDAHGYVNLRCTASPGCPSDVHPHNFTEEDVARDDTRARLNGIYQHLFNVTAEHVPQDIGGVCCAQFAVSREQIRQRPKSDYVRMLNWLETYDRNDFDKGWVMEKVWHIVFGKESVHCPESRQCRCDLYGWCGPFLDGAVLVPVKTPR